MKYLLFLLIKSMIKEPQTLKKTTQNQNQNCIVT